MWILIVSVPDHCLSFYFGTGISRNAAELHVCSNVTLESTPFALTLQNIRTNQFGR